MSGVEKQNEALRRTRRSSATGAMRAGNERKVAMDNALTQAAHGLSLSEKRLVMLAVSKLDSRKPLKPGSALPWIRVTAREYAETYGLNPNSGVAYEALKNAADNLFERKITFLDDEKPIRYKVRWVGLSVYHDGEGWIELEWASTIVPYLFGLQKHFTTYQLQQASALRSIYSWRLLELLSQFKSQGWAEYTIEGFKAVMETPPSLSDFAQLKRRVIEPAVRELIEKDGWEIQWQPIKVGQWKVKGIRFNFVRSPQGQIVL